MPEFAELEERRTRALAERDIDTLAQLCHSQLRYTHSTGSTDTCQSYLERCRTGYYLYESIDCEVLSSTVIGATVIFEECMRAQVKVAGQPRSLNTRALAVWAQADGIWKFVAYHAAAV